MTTGQKRRSRVRGPHERGARLAATAARGLPVIATYLMVVVVTAMSLISLAALRDDAADCHARIYRDPLSGRAQGIGSARPAADGAAACGTVVYPAMASKAAR